MIDGPRTAVYVFSLSATCDAEPNRVLKVEKWEQDSAARYCLQHYLP